MEGRKRNRKILVRVPGGQHGTFSEDEVVRGTHWNERGEPPSGRYLDVHAWRTVDGEQVTTVTATYAPGQWRSVAFADSVVTDG